MKYLLAAIAFITSIVGAPACAQTAANTPTQYVDVDGNRIGYRSIGSGTPIVLATRMRGTLDTWDPLFLDELADHRRRQRPEHGNTELVPSGRTAADGAVADLPFSGARTAAPVAEAVGRLHQ